mmetsp:Transcript_23513/g.58537  ORF Transcript_23513/g.58537 Transcript_23513/m.58537 type:complete len:985 (-) Transcript_23513:71-3025(-)
MPCWHFASEEAKQKFEQNADDDLRKGLKGDRSCTDIIFLIAFIIGVLVYIFVSTAGAAYGNPKKLIQPRDYQGAYCGVEKNWNNGPNLNEQEYLSHTMNITSMIDTIAKELVCSTEAEQILTQGKDGYPALLSSTVQKEDYLCACCLRPCQRCMGSLDVDTSVWDKVSSKMAVLTDPLGGSDLFNPAGLNGDFFSSLWSSTDEFFTRVCLTDCSVDYTKVSNYSETRTAVYEPARDEPLWFAWQVLKNTTSPMAQSIHDVVSKSFTFTAYPESVCPYPAMYCVPMPGVKFETMVGGYCNYEMGAEVVAAIGSSAADAFESLAMQITGSGSAFEYATDLGAWMGDFLESLDTFVLVAVISFIIGFLYIIVARFVLACCIWTAAILTVLVWPFSGGLVYLLSMQCADASLLETGQGVATSVAVAGTTMVEVALEDGNISWEFASEVMTGNGADYRGIQKHTQSGRLCQGWNTQTPHVPLYNSSTDPDAGLISNFCRNPVQPDDRLQAPTIWCYTTDAAHRWEACTPVGVLKPECVYGYAVPDEGDRKSLEITAYVLWACGAIWILLVVIMKRRINLAIAINKVAGRFITHTPQVLLIPIAQAVFSCLWVALWFFLACFLLSQVPDSYSPTSYFASYAEAYGTSDTPGACTDKWPTGFTWKTENCEISTEDDGSELVKCWRCAPPRYVLDARFFYAVFMFLWVNALKVAIGQTIIAGAVAIWFFQEDKRSSRGKISGSVWNVFRFHLGSLCFGSLIIATVQFIRFCLKYLEKQAQAQKNSAAVVALRVSQCCMYCFETLVKFISRKAYIQIALLGNSFCFSAQRAFFLILRNIVRYAMVSVVGNFVETIGVVFITLTSMTLGYLILHEMHPEVYPMVPMIVYFFTTVMIAKLFMSVFGLTVSAALQCFLIAEEMGVMDVYVPKELRWAMDHHRDNPAARGTITRWTLFSQRPTRFGTDGAGKLSAQNSGHDQDRQSRFSSVRSRASE